MTKSRLAWASLVLLVSLGLAAGCGVQRSVSEDAPAWLQGQLMAPENAPIIEGEAEVVEDRAPDKSMT